MKAINEFVEVLLHCDPIDFRKGIFGLSAYVQAIMHEDPFSNRLFVFCNRARSSIKILYWDKSGFALWIKVLEKEKFPWPKKHTQERMTLQSDEFEWLLQGFDIFNLKPHKTLNFTQTV